MFQKAPELKHMSMMYFVGCTIIRCLDFWINFCVVDIYMYSNSFCDYRGNQQRILLSTMVHVSPFFDFYMVYTYMYILMYIHVLQCQNQH